MENIINHIENNTLTDEEKKFLLKVVQEYLKAKEYEDKKIENTKETVFGKR